MILAASTAELTLRMLVSLAVIGGVLFLVSKLAKNRLPGAAARAEIDIRARRQLTKSSSVAVIRAGSRHFLIGMNDHAMTLLAEGDDLAVNLDGELQVVAEPADGTVEIQTDRPTEGRKARAGARTRQRGVNDAASPGMSVIEALRERTVRRG